MEGSRAGPGDEMDDRSDEREGESVSVVIGGGGEGRPAPLYPSREDLI